MRTVFISIILAIGITSLLFAQEMIVNGTFDSEEGWTVYDLDTTVPCIAEFGVDDGMGPAQGEGAYLNIYGEADTYINILIWQELTLQAGTTYELTGAFKDLTDGDLQNYWCELYLSTEAPVADADWTPPGGANTDDRLAFNTWDGCGPSVDGTFQDDGCGAGHSPYYTPPGTAGEDVTVYFGIKTGIWTQGTFYYFEVAVDNVSLIPEGGSSVQESSNSPYRFYLYPNFPNPFNPYTTIQFALAETSEMAVSIFDVHGRLVRTLTQGIMAAGIHLIKWNGLDDQGNILPSGVYLCKLESGIFSETQRMILMK